MTPNDINILAKTIYGEVRGEYNSLEGGMASLIAVGNVVMNRLKTPHIFDHTISQVCLKPKQFSCWNVHDPNHALIMKNDISDSIFSICSDVASKVAKGDWPDITKGSDHYHATYLPSKPPWARNCKPRVQIAKHIFYQLMKGN